MRTITINGLFGRKNHTIDITDRCMILIGENGSGKSTIIKIIKALSELNFIELSKYRFESIEYNDDSSMFRFEFSDIMPISQKDVGYIYPDDLRYPDESSYPDDTSPHDYYVEVNFMEEFNGHFKHFTSKLFSPNRFAWILACLFHGKNIDKSDLKLIEKAKKQAFEKCDFPSNPESNSYEQIYQININESLKKSVVETEFSTSAHGIFGLINFDIMLFKYSNIYYGRFGLESTTEEICNNLKNLDGLRETYIDILPNEKFLEIALKIGNIKKLLGIEDCLLIDMTSQFDIVNEPCYDSPNIECPWLADLKQLSISTYKLGVDEIYRDKMNKLRISLYQKCLGYINSFKYLNDNTGSYTELPRRTDLSWCFEDGKPTFLNNFVDNKPINISEIISDTFFTTKTVITINDILIRKYISALEKDEVYEVGVNDKMYDILSEFFFDKYYELKDWFEPVILSNTVFDFDYDFLRYSSPRLEELDDKFHDFINSFEDDRFNPQKSKHSKFNFIHVLFYDFYNSEFSKIKKKQTDIVSNFVKVLRKFLVNKKVTVSPAGLRISDMADSEIEPKYLSSGEKKILALLIIAMFIKDVTLLIDEPEISISVIWQSMILPALINDTAVDKIIVSTQSPFLIEDESMMKYLQALN